MGVGRDLDRDDCVAASAGALLALPAKPDAGAILKSLGQLEINRPPAAERDPLRLERRGIDERDLEAVGDVGADPTGDPRGLRTGLVPACARAGFATVETASSARPTAGLRSIHPLGTGWM